MTISMVEVPPEPDAMLERLKAKFHAAAVEHHHRDGECEIDDSAEVSISDGGAYVQAWIWVTNEEAGVESE